jgi:hypothetical protein
VFAVSTLGPAITLNLPEDDTYYNATDVIVNFNYTVSDPDGIGACFLYGNWSGGWHINQTDYAVENDETNIFNVSVESDGEGKYIWNIWCNDTLGLESFAVLNYTFGIDITNPKIDFGDGTEVDGFNVSRDWIYVNASVVEVNEANITFRLHNSSGEVNVSILEAGTREINWTSLAEGNYSYNVTVHDLANNYNTSQTRRITLDTTPLGLIINYPGEKNYSLSSIDFNLTTDEYSPFCNYTLNEGITNYTMSTVVRLKSIEDKE